MAADDSFWYRVGYAAERAATRVKAVGESPDDADAPPPPRVRPVRGRRPTSRPSGEGLERLLVAAGSAAAARVLERLTGSRQPGLLSLLRAGAAGAVAALLLEFARPLFTDDTLSVDVALADELLAGAGTGLVYAALAEPHLPGPPSLRGAVYGSADFLAAPWGGLGSVLRPVTPQKKIPVLGSVVGEGVQARSYLEHLAFAVAMAELYGSPSGDG